MSEGNSKVSLKQFSDLNVLALEETYNFEAGFFPMIIAAKHGIIPADLSFDIFATRFSLILIETGLPFKIRVSKINLNFEKIQYQ